MISKIIFFMSVVLLLFVRALPADIKIIDATQDPKVPYRLFPTNNIWTFIKLETSTGKMWQIQFSIDDSSRGSVPLNLGDLAKDKKRIPGRFTLYSTQNMFTFILVDQIEGNTWQVQWALESEIRGIIPISE